jgi:hypothetical protein
MKKRRNKLSLCKKTIINLSEDIKKKIFDMEEQLIQSGFSENQSGNLLEADRPAVRKTNRKNSNI